MNIYKKYISLFVVGFLVVILLSTSGFPATSFYIESNDSTQKTDCDFLEIKNNYVLCTSNNLVLTYDIANVNKIDVIRNDTLQYFQKFTQESINRINELSSNKSATSKTGSLEANKDKTFDFIFDYAQSFLNNFKSPSTNNFLNTILVISGLTTLLIGSVGFLIGTFRAGILWGISCMFLPFISFVFLFLHWKTASKPFLITIFGISILFLSTMFPSTSEPSRSFYKLHSSTIRENNATFRCSGEIYCSEMSSCAEATFYLRNCPGTKMDGDNDGIPCEKQWCSN